MKRFPLMIAFGAIGLAVLAGVGRQLSATESNGYPDDNLQCYHNAGTCSYLDSMGYWSGCRAGEGLMTTNDAKSACAQYNAS